MSPECGSLKKTFFTAYNLNFESYKLMTQRIITNILKNFKFIIVEIVKL